MLRTGKQQQFANDMLNSLQLGQHDLQILLVILGAFLHKLSEALQGCQRVADLMGYACGQLAGDR
ncbi:hypothetical protein D3C81_2119860 [compost metagenome]